MEPDSKSHPILSYVMSRKPPQQPFIKPSQFPVNRTLSEGDRDVKAGIGKEIENEVLVNQLPNLKNPEILALMTAAVSDVVHVRDVLQCLGPRPDHEAVDQARINIAQIESRLSKQLESIVLGKRPEGVDRREWRSQQATKEKEAREAAEREMLPFKAVIHLDEKHDEYENLLKDAEQQLADIYESSRSYYEVLPVKDEVNEEVVRVLQEASHRNLEKLELRGRMLRFIPEAFGKLATLTFLDLSNNQLEALPDSVAGLTNLEALYLSSNMLVSLPDYIGLLKSLKVLNVSANKLKALPDSISRCSALIELDTSFNQLTYLPTNIGNELVNLQKFFVHLNKLRSLPSSICEMESLRVLDVHFNELRSLPLAIGKLQNLEILNASSNFSDLTTIPDTIGDLTNLVDLDLSNNQIKELPCSFGRLNNLKKLNLDQNPFVIPPQEIVQQGLDAVLEYMKNRWVDILLEEEGKSKIEADNSQAEQNWMQRSGQWLEKWFFGSPTGYVGTTRNKTIEDDFLNQQL